MRPALIALLLLLATTAHAGEFRVDCVAPVDDNASESCDSVVSVPRWGNPPMTVYLTWQSTRRGGVMGADSLTCFGGDTLSFWHWIPGGAYYTSLWAVDAGGAGCSSDSVRVVKGWPGKVRIIK